MSRMEAGLSAAQKNDWAWFKESWDKEMVVQHGAKWGSLFATWMQNVLEDERSNASSHFVFNETRRVFHDTAALHVPRDRPRLRPSREHRSRGGRDREHPQYCRGPRTRNA